MDCKKAEKLVPEFLNDELDIDDMREFLAHVEGCSECREELTIEFLVKEGMARLETGAVFDLNKELNIRMKRADHILKVRENLKLLYYGLSGLVGVEIVTVVLMFIFLKPWQ